MVNNLPANAGNTRDTNSISVVGRYPVIRKPFLITFLITFLQYFCWKIAWTEQPGGLVYWTKKVSIFAWKIPWTEQPSGLVY